MLASRRAPGQCPLAPGHGLGQPGEAGHGMSRGHRQHSPCTGPRLCLQPAALSGATTDVARRESLAHGTE